MTKTDIGKLILEVSNKVDWILIAREKGSSAFYQKTYDYRVTLGKDAAYSTTRKNKATLLEALDSIEDLQYNYPLERGY